MGALFRTYIIWSIVFAISYGAVIININKYSDNELEPSVTELHSYKNLDDSEILPHKHEYINGEVTYNCSCPIHPKPADCSEVFENGLKTSGVYEVYPKNKIVSYKTIRVYCDMKTDGGGWTVIQRRGNSQRSPDYFHKNWNEYKTGFGNLETEFWLGNDNIHALTNQKRYAVRFDLGVDNETAYAIYDTFWIENEELKYRLNITDYSGTAGDSMTYHDGKPFSSKDRKNNPSNSDCAKLRKGGWWYKDCSEASLNGERLTGNYTKAMVNSKGIYWISWKGYAASLTNVEMKILPFDFKNK